MICQNVKKDCSNKKFNTVYILKGEPHHFYYPKSGSSELTNVYKQNKIKQHITLESQHNLNRKYRGPLALYIDFYFKLPERCNHSKNGVKENESHTTIPDLGNCIKHIERLACGILFDHEGSISSVYASKFYSSDPRTEFYLKEFSN